MEKQNLNTYKELKNSLEEFYLNKYSSKRPDEYQATFKIETINDETVLVIEDKLSDNKGNLQVLKDAADSIEFWKRKLENYSVEVISDKVLKTRLLCLSVRIN